MEEPSDISNGEQARHGDAMVYAVLYQRSCANNISFAGQPMDEMVASDDEAEPAAEEFEDDPKRLIARQKQIDFGKNTIGYENYLKAVPK